MSPHEAALISEYEARGLAERIRLIAGYDYQGLCSAMSLWRQVSDIHMLAMGSVDPERDYRQIALESPRPFGPCATVKPWQSPNSTDFPAPTKALQPR